jgi:hypothetical protein
MTITMEQLLELCEACEFNVDTHEEMPNVVTLRFAMDHYLDSDGDNGLLFVVEIELEGEMLTVFAPNAYNAKDCAFRGALFNALLQLQYRNRLGAYEYDADDGEIRYKVDLPVKSATVTPDQFHWAVTNVPAIVDMCDPVVREVMKTGRIDLDLVALPDDG